MLIYDRAKYKLPSSRGDSAKYAMRTKAPMSKQLRSITLIALFFLLFVTLARLDWHAALAGPPSQTNSPLPPPPPNDNFNRAKTIESLPFVESVNLAYATRQTREPQPSCVGSAPLGQTVWYKFRPTTTSIFILRAATESTFVSIYTGNTLTGLSQKYCFTEYIYGAPVTLTAGTTYYFQAGGMYGYSSYLYFALDPVPAPTVYVNYYPYDPSSFDTLNFWGGVDDPARQEVQQWSWNFGDGTTSTEAYPQHRYQNDGDYAVTLAVVTTDGRSSSTSQTIQIRTHDVTIKKLARPKSARVGQTRKLVISVSNSRYPENVQVQLYKSTLGGFTQVGFLRQYVDVKPNGQATDFHLSYTFTPEDVQVGKVIFKAVALIENYRDIFPADNEFISFAVNVTSGGNATGLAEDAVNSAGIDDMSDYATDEESNVAETLATKAGEGTVEVEFMNFLPLVNK